MAKKRISGPLLLLISAFVVATCGLIYELVSGTLASYLLGDSVTQFSTIIGVYLFSMGIGSYLSKFFKKNLLFWFIQLEILVGIIGGCSSSVLFLLFEHVESFRFLLYFLVMLTGILVGLEIPLLMRILQHQYEFKDLVSRIFTVDYIGALLASVIFPLVLIPYLGLIKTSFFFGLLNVAVALFVCRYYRKEISNPVLLQSLGMAVMFALTLGMVFSEKIMSWAENMAYPDKVVYAKSTPYQRIVLTKNRNEIRLFLNGNLQFSSTDEYRYHEALVHPALQMSTRMGHVPRRVLILGGGDGLAIRECLRYPHIDSITLVDLDPEMTRLFREHPMLTRLNQESLSSPRVSVINKDAFQWIKTCNRQYDAVIIDFPDPSNYSIGKLYSTTFYRELKRILAPQGCAVIQSTSPFVAKQSFWCVDTTLKASGFHTLPYHTFVPSFGDWGYLMAAHKAFPQTSLQFPKTLKFIDEPGFIAMTHFPRDMQPGPVEPNKLNNQILVHYFEHEWAIYQ